MPPKKIPNFKTKYEEDPDYNPGSQIQSTSRQPKLRRSKSFSEISSLDSPHADESISRFQGHTNTLKTSSQLSLQEKSQLSEMVLDTATVNQIVQAVITAQQAAANNISNPKVIPEKLNDKNYFDWTKKMKIALKLNNLWLEPTTNPATLNESATIKNERAALYLGSYLDEKHSSFINDSNEKCFITIWNDIAKFKEPRTSVVLTDIHRQIQKLQHQAGQSIETHLMKLEAQFTRFTNVKKKLDDEHLVALTLASVIDSPDFANVIESAMWEDDTTLTLSKIKSVLISTQRRRSSDNNEEAHASGYNSQPKKNVRPFKRHNRKPKDPVKGRDVQSVKWTTTQLIIATKTNRNQKTTNETKKQNLNMQTKRKTRKTATLQKLTQASVTLHTEPLILLSQSKVG